MKDYLKYGVIDNMKSITIVIFLMLLCVSVVSANDMGSCPAEDPQDRILIFGRCFSVESVFDDCVLNGKNVVEDVYVRISVHSNRMFIINIPVDNSVSHVYVLSAKVNYIIDIVGFSGCIVCVAGRLLLNGWHDNVRIVSW